MKTLSNNLCLQAVTLEDQTTLYALMEEIYTPAYKHLWEDHGQWYLQQNYTYANLAKELEDLNATYQFVLYEGEKVGIYRLLYKQSLEDFPNKQATKLHRLYLHPKLHGKGAGKILMDFAKKEAKEQKSSLLWLEAMDTQKQALKFYEKHGFIISGDFKLNFSLMYKKLRGMHRMYYNLL